MPKYLRVTSRFCLLLAAFVLQGCESKDKEVLERIGQKVASRLEASVARQDGGWQQALERLPQRSEPAKAEPSLRDQVLARLKWDRTLKDLVIDVSEQDGVIELRGKVQQSAQKARAIELAETTVGVAQVQEYLEIVPGEGDPAEEAQDLLSALVWQVRIA